MTTACSNCQFSHRIPYKLDDGTTGENTFCRFNPPVSINELRSSLLPVAPDGWCGQWVEKVQKRRSATKSVPAPVSDPNTERSLNLSVRSKSKKGVAAII